MSIVLQAFRIPDRPTTPRGRIDRGDVHASLRGPLITSGIVGLIAAAQNFAQYDFGAWTWLVSIVVGQGAVEFLERLLAKGDREPMPRRRQPDPGIRRRQRRSPSSWPRR